MPPLSERLAQLRLDRIRSFLAVVRYGSFSAAAHQIYLSQSRVSSHIADLERAFGTTLFDRSRLPVELTETGRQLLTHAQQVVAALNAAEQDVAEAEHGRVTGRVTVGMYPSVAAYLFPRLVQAVRAEHPGIELELWEGATLELDPALLSGDVDLALRAEQPEPPGADRLSRRPLWTEPLVAVLPPDDPFPAAGVQPAELDIAALADRDLITIGSRDGAGDHVESTEAFAQAGITPRLAFRTNQPQTLLALVAEGLGIGVINWLAVHTAQHHGLQVIPIRGRGCERKVALWWREGGLLPVRRAVAESVVELAADAFPAPLSPRGDAAE